MSKNFISKITLISAGIFVLFVFGTLSASAQSVPLARTFAPDHVTETTAVLQGEVEPRGASASVWIEYGTTQSLGQIANLPSTGSDSRVYDVRLNLRGLTSGTIYYYRVVAQNTFGKANGSILNFRTLGTTPVNPPPPSPPPPANQPPPPPPPNQNGNNPDITGNDSFRPTIIRNGTGSCFMLTPSLGDEPRLNSGEEFLYALQYRNDCGFDLKNVSIKIVLPEVADFSRSNYPFLVRDANMIIYDLDVVARNFQSTILIHGIAKAGEGETAMFVSSGQFEDSIGGSHSTSISFAIGVSEGENFVANVFGAMGDLARNALFWVVIVVLILVLALSVYLRKRNGVHALELPEDSLVGESAKDGDDKAVKGDSGE